MGFSIEIKGLSRTQRLLKQTSKKIDKQANKAIIKAGFFIEGEVKESIAGHRNLPITVDTGRFLNSVKAEQKAPLTVKISTNVSYAEVLEFGTSTRQPRPHFQHTAKRNEKKVKDFIEREISKI